mgnify:CR=1 FL=1
MPAMQGVMPGVAYPGMPMGGVGMEPTGEPSGLQVRSSGAGAGRKGR